MKRMTDAELARVIFDSSSNPESTVSEIELDLRKNARDDLVMVFRAIESAAYERAAQICDARGRIGAIQGHTADDCAVAIRGLKYSIP